MLRWCFSASKERRRDGWQQTKQLLLFLRCAFPPAFIFFLACSLPLFSSLLACGLHVSERLPFAGNYSFIASLCVFARQIKHPQTDLKKNSQTMYMKCRVQLKYLKALNKRQWDQRHQKSVCFFIMPNPLRYIDIIKIVLQEMSATLDVFMQPCSFCYGFPLDCWSVSY